MPTGRVASRRSSRCSSAHLPNSRPSCRLSNLERFSKDIHDHSTFHTASIAIFSIAFRRPETKLLALPAANIDPDALDALLCRLVFACYLFDRDVIGEHYKEQLGLPHAAHLRDVLGLQPTAKAKEQLYRLFERLGTDFNGDLFSDDLEAEASLVSASQH